MAYTWYTKGSGLDFDSHENYVDYTDKIHSQTGVAFNCGAPNVTKNIDNLTDFYIGFTVYYAEDNPGGYGTWNWLNVTGNDTAFIKGSDNYLCCMPDSNGYKPPYKKGLSHIIVHVDTVNDKIEYWYNLQKVYTRESAGIAGKSYTAINMCPTGGKTNYAQRDNAISDLIITTEKTELDKYTSKFFQPVSITFDGKTNYAEIPVSLTDVSDWSAEIIFTTTENGSDYRVYHQPCLFGYDTVNFLSRDFHVDTSGGNLYVFNGLGNSSAPVGGTVICSIKWDGNDCGVNTGIKVNDGKKHTVKAISTTGKIEVYCDGVLATTIYPTTTLNANAFYIGCSKISESVFGRLTLYSFKLTKNGKVVAEYEPTTEQTIFHILKDKSGNSNDALLYGAFHTYASGIPVSATEVLATDTSSIPIALCLVNHDSASAEINIISEVLSTTSSGIPTIIAEIKSKNYDFVQPTLTADGKFREDVFAVRAGGGTQTAWGAFTDDANTRASSINNGSYIDIYTAIPIIVDYIKISSNGNMPAHGILEYSDDGEVFTPCGKWKDRDEKGIWDVAFCDDSNGHCYWRVKSTADSNSAIAKLDIYANKAQYIRKCLIEKVNGVDWRTVALINKTKRNKIFKLNNLSTNKTIVI